MNAVDTPLPVTVIVTRRVRPGKAAEFQRTMAGMMSAASAFAGHRGAFMVPPETAEDGCWRVIFAFDTPTHLRSWTDSPQRQRWLGELAASTHGDAATRVLSGLETWFALPAAAVQSPPPRWKMALVTWLGIFPLVLLISTTLTPALLRFVDVPLATLAATAVITVAMTWIVMPTLVRVLARWLYPASRHDGKGTALTRKTR